MPGNGWSEDSLRVAIKTAPHARLLGQDPRIHSVNSLVAKLASTNLTVFITGETGTGKDIVAALLHNSGPRARRPFVKLNCPSIPLDLLESELFGHELGAFTGAHTSRPGRLELARDGTLFLDEICETSLQAQSRLLHVLDGEPYMRVGGTRCIPMSARIIAAANVSAEEAVAQGRLRQDLAFRLGETVISLPPLRERVEDIPLLAEHFHYHACEVAGKEYQPLKPEVHEYLQEQRWEGNVRQLAGWVREFVANDYPESVLLKGANGSNRRSSGSGDAGGETDDARREKQFMPLSEAGRLAAEKAERALIEDTLRYTRWNRRKAAKLLDTSYSSLLRRIAKYKLGQA